jgi:hypothetical protein
MARRFHIDAGRVICPRLETTRFCRIFLPIKSFLDSACGISVIRQIKQRTVATSFENASINESNADDI